MTLLFFGGLPQRHRPVPDGEVIRREFAGPNEMSFGQVIFTEPPELERQTVLRAGQLLVLVGHELFGACGRTMRSSSSIQITVGTLRLP